MGALINVSLNLDKLDKSKISKSKSGNYYNITISVNDNVNQYGNNVSVFDKQTVEEYSAKADKSYVGNGKVFWTDGTIVAAPKEEPQQAQAATQDVDLPF